MGKLYAYDKRLAQFLMVSFFLPLRVQVFVLIPICVFFAVRDVITNGFPKTVTVGATILFVSFYLLYLLYLPFTPKTFQPEVLFQLEQKASILLMPIVFILITDKTRALIFQQLWLFVVACVISCFMGNVFYLIYHSADTVPSHVAYRLFFEGATGIHPTYMGMYICLSISWLLYTHHWADKLRGWVVAVCFIVMLLFLFALLPKVLIIALFAILLHFLIVDKATGQKKIIVSVALLLAIIITVLFIPFSTQRLAEIWKPSHIEHGKALVDNSMDMRKLIWKIDMTVLQNNWVLGVGPGQTPTKLHEQYFLYSIIIKYPLGTFDTHNQYINQWIGFGVFGILLFLSILTLHFYKAVKTKNSLYLYLLFILCVTFSTENVLSNQHGVVFYAFFTMLFFYTSSKDEEYLALNISAQKS